MLINSILDDNMTTSNVITYCDYDHLHGIVSIGDRHNEVIHGASVGGGGACPIIRIATSICAIMLAVTVTN